MAKRVIDILPPNRKASFVQEKKSIEVSEKRSLLKGALTVIFALIILVFVALHFFFAKADIEVVPKTQPFNFSATVTVDQKASSVIAEQSLIPAEIFEVEKEAVEDFPATGSVLKKAEGAIRLFNNFTTQTETWLKGTRFVSSEGKLFLSKEAIRVPGATLKNGKISPSFIDVPVIAAVGGQEYNIGPSNFSIAAFLGTARYTQYHGESSKAMSGGGVFLKVGREDLEKAEALLTEKAKNESEAELAKLIPEGFLILKEAVQSEILEKSSSASIDQETEKFEFRVKAKASVISFKSEDIRGLAEHFVLSQLEPGKTFYKEGLRTEYLFQAFNLQEQRILAEIRGSTLIYSEIDINSLKRSLAGKSAKEAKILIEGQEELSRAKIKLFPFWLNSLPKSIDKISLKLKID